MSLGLTKPGMRSADLTGKIHPKTGLELEPIGYLRDGTAVWPQFGASPDDDDPDDPEFTGEDEDEDDEDDEDDKKPSKKKPVKKTKSKADDDDDDDDDDDEDDKPTRPERQAARYRVRLRESEKRNADLEARLKAIEDKGKPADEIAKREAHEAKSKADKLADKVRTQNLELAFFKTNVVDWVDPADALKLVDLDDVDVDEDGTVDPVQLRKALRALAKSKPHLVKKPKTESSDDDDENEDDEPGSRRTAPAMNRKRKGESDTPNRDALAKKFPILRRV